MSPIETSTENGGTSVRPNPDQTPFVPEAMALDALFDMGSDAAATGLMVAEMTPSVKEDDFFWLEPMAQCDVTINPQEGIEKAETGNSTFTIGDAR